MLLEVEPLPATRLTECVHACVNICKKSMCSEPETTSGFLSFYLNIKDVCGCANILNVDTVGCCSSEGCGSVGFYTDYLSCTSKL